ncbi:hypothetical protein [Leadbetterella byssophila]|uniref:hypothetical protein n=1 Tax=Leadbetterella byssophila TaxID=316068 RepID=UPI0039A061A7
MDVNEISIGFWIFGISVLIFSFFACNSEISVQRRLCSVGICQEGILDVSFRGNAIGTDPVWNCFRIECLVVSGGSGSMAPDFGRFGFVYIW